MRRLSRSLYVLIAVSEVLQNAIVPLVPAYAERFGLSEVQSGALLASTSVATLVVSLPAGFLADRFGARRLTLWAGAALAVAAVGQALAPSFALLLAARLLFGVGFGIMWTTGLTWLSEQGSGSGALGASVTSAGVGVVVAPGFAGLVAERLGLGAPFLLAGLVAATVTAVLASAGGGRAPVSAEPGPTLVTLRGAGRDTGVVGAVVAIAVGGLAGSVINLLAPIELHAAGFTEATIGLAFSAAAVVFIAASLLAVGRGERATGVPVVGAAALLFAVALAPAVASAAAAAIVVAMCLTAPMRALLFTAAYPLGARSAPRAGVGAGAVLGLLNVVWALTTIVGPLAGGALLQAIGARSTYGVLQAVAVAALAALWVHARWARTAVRVSV